MTSHDTMALKKYLQVRREKHLDDGSFSATTQISFDDIRNDDFAESTSGSDNGFELSSFADGVNNDDVAVVRQLLQTSLAEKIELGEKVESQAEYIRELSEDVNDLKFEAAQMVTSVESRNNEFKLPYLLSMMFLALVRRTFVKWKMFIAHHSNTLLLRERTLSTILLLSCCRQRHNVFRALASWKQHVADSKTNVLLEASANFVWSKNMLRYRLTCWKSIVRNKRCIRKLVTTLRLLYIRRHFVLWVRTEIFTKTSTLEKLSSSHRITTLTLAMRSKCQLQHLWMRCAWTRWKVVTDSIHRTSTLTKTFVATIRRQQLSQCLQSQRHRQLQIDSNSICAAFHRWKGRTDAHTKIQNFMKIVVRRLISRDGCRLLEAFSHWRDTASAARRECNFRREMSSMKAVCMLLGQRFRRSRFERSFLKWVNFSRMVQFTVCTRRSMCVSVLMTRRSSTMHQLKLAVHTWKLHSQAKALAQQAAQLALGHQRESEILVKWRESAVRRLAQRRQAFDTRNLCRGFRLWATCAVKNAQQRGVKLQRCWRLLDHHLIVVQFVAFLRWRSRVDVDKRVGRLLWRCIERINISRLREAFNTVRARMSWRRRADQAILRMGARACGRAAGIAFRWWARSTQHAREQETVLRRFVCSFAELCRRLSYRAFHRWKHWCHWSAIAAVTEQTHRDQFNRVSKQLQLIDRRGGHLHSMAKALHVQVRRMMSSSRKYRILRSTFAALVRVCHEGYERKRRLQALVGGIALQRWWHFRCSGLRRGFEGFKRCHRQMVLFSRLCEQHINRKWWNFRCSGLRRGFESFKRCHRQMALFSRLCEQHIRRKRVGDLRRVVHAWFEITSMLRRDRESLKMPQSTHRLRQSEYWVFPRGVYAMPNDYYDGSHTKGSGIEGARCLDKTVESHTIRHKSSGTLLTELFGVSEGARGSGHSRSRNGNRREATTSSGTKPSAYWATELMEAAMVKARAEKLYEVLVFRLARSSNRTIACAFREWTSFAMRRARGAKRAFGRWFRRWYIKIVVLKMQRSNRRRILLGVLRKKAHICLQIAFRSWAAHRASQIICERKVSLLHRVAKSVSQSRLLVKAMLVAWREWARARWIRRLREWPDPLMVVTLKNILRHRLQRIRFVALDLWRRAVKFMKRVESCLSSLINTLKRGRAKAASRGFRQWQLACFAMRCLEVETLRAAERCVQRVRLRCLKNTFTKWALRARDGLAAAALRWRPRMDASARSRRIIAQLEAAAIAVAFQCEESNVLPSVEEPRPGTRKVAFPSGSSRVSIAAYTKVLVEALAALDAVLPPNIVASLYMPIASSALIGLCSTDLLWPSTKITSSVDLVEQLQHVVGGEGVVGRCAMDKRPQCFTSVDDRQPSMGGTVKTPSLLQSQTPRVSILVIPLEQHHIVVGTDKVESLAAVAILSVRGVDVADRFLNASPMGVGGPSTIKSHQDGATLWQTGGTFHDIAHQEPWAMREYRYEVVQRQLLQMMWESGVDEGTAVTAATVLWAMGGVFSNVTMLHRMALTKEQALAKQRLSHETLVEEMTTKDSAHKEALRKASDETRALVQRLRGFENSREEMRMSLLEQKKEMETLATSCEKFRRESLSLRRQVDEAAEMLRL